MTTRKRRSKSVYSGLACVCLRRGSAARTSVFGLRTFPDFPRGALNSTHSSPGCDHLIGKVSATGQPTPPPKWPAGWPIKTKPLPNYQKVVLNRIKSLSMRLDLFVKLKNESRTVILFFDNRYSMRDLLSDFNNYALPANQRYASYMGNDVSASYDVSSL